MKGYLTKRAFDIGILVLSFPVWLPLLILVAALVYLKLGRPIFFRQARPGLHAKLFEVVKFRTMIDVRDALGRPLPDAERLPSFGRWLRSTSLDELPELLNVLRGEMSLVGPRPLLIKYLDRYNARQARRHDVLPGVTGLAQVKGRNALSWEEKFEWDVKYVETRTFWVDIRILFETVRAVLTRRGISAVGEATMPEFDPTAQ